MLDHGAHAFCSSGVQKVLSYTETWPQARVYVWCFSPGLGGVKEEMATKATLCLLSSRGASGVVAAAPRAQCIAGTVQRPASLGAALLTRSGGNLKLRKWRAESCSSLILGNLFSKQFVLTGCIFNVKM